MFSQTEENYLKAIYKLTSDDKSSITTNEIAAHINTKPASVTDMLKRLSGKKLIHYKKYNGVSLTTLGMDKAVSIVRKHRLWEFFLLEKLGFNWDEIHEVAEELEHIQSELLIQRLDAFLGHPKFDPHGDPIPDEKGKFAHKKLINLADMKPAEQGKVATVLEQRPSFLQHLDMLKIKLNTPVKVVEIFNYDKSMKLELDKGIVQLSFDVAKNILIAI